MHIVRTPLGLLTFLSYIPALLKRRGELRLFLVQRPSHQWVLRSFFRLAACLQLNSKAETSLSRLPCARDFGALPGMPRPRLDMT